MEQEQKPRVRSFISELVPDWRPSREQVLRAVRGVIVIAVVLGILTLIGLPFGITLWAWLKLLIVPAVIAAGGIWFNRQQRDREMAIAEQRSQDETLQAYLDQMSQMLTDKERPLHRAQQGDSLSTVARARTLTVLTRLDGDRQRSVVQFLYDSDLITKDRAVLDLREADLSRADLSRVFWGSAHLRRIYLNEANLSRASLNGAVLRGSAMRQANLTEADVNDADLGRVDLTEADMRGVHLLGANLSQAILTGATMRSDPNLWGATNLSQADLSYANLTEADLRSAGLVSADLVYATLSRADLSGADLLLAKLRSADLTEANLSKAQMRGAILRQADLTEADMSGASGVTDAQLAEAKSLEGATMPDGQRLRSDWDPDKPTFEEWLKSKGRGEDAENGGP